MIAFRTSRAAARLHHRSPVLLACLLAMAVSPAVLSSPQATTSSEPSEAPSIDAPVLEAGEPWSLRIADVPITAFLRTDPIETGTPILIEFLQPSSGDGGDLAILELPEPGTRLGSFEVIDAPRRDEPRTGDRRRPAMLSLRTFEPGAQELPPMTIGLGESSIRTPARILMVASIAGLDTDVEAHQDIASAVEVSSPLPIWLWWTTAAGVAAVLAILALLWWWRRRPRPAAVPEPADSWALQRLDRLASDDLLRDGRVDPFFTRLTDIAREYVERRFGIAAPERTTPEFIEAARSDPAMEPAHRDRVLRLGAVLRTADLVKFAGDRPARTVGEDALDQVRELVIEIGPKPAPAPDEADGGTERVETNRNDLDRRRSLHRAVDGLERMEARE